MSGNIIEITKYSKIPTRVSNTGRSNKATIENMEINRATNIKKAKKVIGRIIRANGSIVDSKFITLTFSDNVVDIAVKSEENPNGVLRKFYMGTKECGSIPNVRCDKLVDLLLSEVKMGYRDQPGKGSNYEVFKDISHKDLEYGELLKALEMFVPNIIEAWLSKNRKKYITKSFVI
jgi:hypothetical protein